MVDTNVFADWLREKLKQRRWSQEKLAKVADISIGAISKTLRRRSTRPEPETVRSIAEAFDVAPEPLFRMLGWLPEPADIPERDHLEHLLRQMTPETQGTLVALGDALVNRQHELAS